MQKMNKNNLPFWQPVNTLRILLIFVIIAITVYTITIVTFTGLISRSVQYIEEIKDIK